MDILNLILPLNIPLLISLGILGFVYRMFDELQDASMRNKFQKEWWIFKLNWLNTTSSWKNKWALTSTMGCTIKYDKNYHKNMIYFHECSAPGDFENVSFQKSIPHLFPIYKMYYFLNFVLMSLF
mgnify:CR=1 FL=1